MLSLQVSAENLKVKIVKVSLKNNLVVVNKGSSDGLERHDQAQFIANKQVVAQGKLVKIKEGQSLWKVNRRAKVRRLASAEKVKLNLLEGRQMESHGRLTKSDKPKHRFKVGLGTEQLSNRFRLSDDDQQRFESNRAEDQTSRRYVGMDSVADMALVPTLKMSHEFSKSFELDYELAYHMMSKNQDASYLKGGGQLTWDWAGGRELKIEGRGMIDYHQDNDLSGAVDKDNNGNISSSERIYDQARFNEFETELSYQTRAFDQGSHQIDLSPFLGYTARVFDEPFGNQDRSGMFAGGRVSYRFNKEIKVIAGIRLEKLSTGSGQELTLVDEVSAGADLNSDGVQTDNAALVTSVDRSQSRRTLSLGCEAKVSRSVRLELGYSQRESQYSTGNSADQKHFGQTKDRTRVESALRFDLSDNIDLKLGHEMVRDTDFNESTTSLGLRYVGGF